MQWCRRRRRRRSSWEEDVTPEKKVEGVEACGMEPLSRHLCEWMKERAWNGRWMTMQMHMHETCMQLLITYYNNNNNNNNEWMKEGCVAWKTSWERRRIGNAWMRTVERCDRRVRKKRGHVGVSGSVGWGEPE